MGEKILQIELLIDPRALQFIHSAVDVIDQFRRLFADSISHIPRIQILQYLMNLTGHFPLHDQIIDDVLILKQ
ncbi:hypothetical protein D3C81_1255220 [compost metagenome]